MFLHIKFKIPSLNLFYSFVRTECLSRHLFVDVMAAERILRCRGQGVLTSGWLHFCHVVPKGFFKITMMWLQLRTVSQCSHWAHVTVFVKVQRIDAKTWILLNAEWILKDFTNLKNDFHWHLNEGLDWIFSFLSGHTGMDLKKLRLAAKSLESLLAGRGYTKSGTLPEWGSMQRTTHRMWHQHTSNIIYLANPNLTLTWPEPKP